MENDMGGEKSYESANSAWQFSGAKVGAAVALDIRPAK
jgi:hypothetical protein